MNHVYRLVWSRNLAMFVPTAEWARARRKARRAATALTAVLAALAAVGEAQATTFIDFNGGLADWTTGGSVTLHNSTVTVPTGGATFTLTPATGYDMARINAPDGGNLLAPDLTLGLTAGSLASFLNNADGSITNFGLLTKSFSLNVGTYSFAWAYGAEDYQPYNDGAVFTLAGNGSQSLVSLARNGSSGADTTGPSANTLILGSYGATPWITSSFDITTAGTYQLGFAVYNWDDQSLAPNLYVSGVEGTYSGTPAQVSGGTIPPPTPPTPPTPPAPPVIGSTGGNVTGSVFDPSSPSYAAPTLAFEGGTLQYTGNTTTSKDATLSGAGGSIDTNGFDIVYTGVISGGSDFHKAGTGTLTLAAANVYTGATTIDSGILELTGAGTIDASSEVVNNGALDISGVSASGAGIKTISGNGTVELGSKTLTIDQASTTFSGSFSGAGALEVTGGTLTLGGASTSTGGVIVSNGAKVVALNDAAFGAGQLTLDNGALANGISLTLANGIGINGTSVVESATGTSVTATGALSGGGNLVKTGQGSLVLTGDNSSFGTVANPATIVVNDGSLVVGSEKALGGANLQLNQGSLASLTNATLAGTLQVSSGTSISALQGTTLVVASQIGSLDSGSGCFEKNGFGTLVMTGVADIAPGTCVQEGQLYANGHLSSNVTVRTEGSLRGTGFIQGSANVAGRLAPGNSPGTLQVAGNVTMVAGSTYQEDINGTGIGSGPGSYSRLVITGAGNQFVATGATLEPNLVSITGTDNYVPYVPKVGDLFRIVTAEGGVVGTFAAVEQPVGLDANTRIEAFYDVASSHSIDLVVVPASYQAYVDAHAGNRNAESAAGAIDSLAALKQAGTSTSTQDEMLYTVGTSGDIAGVSMALAGEVHGALAAAAPLATRWLVESVGRQLNQGYQPSNGIGLWVDSGAHRSDWRGDEVASGFDTTRWQVAIGWEPLSTEVARLGVGFTHGKVDVKSSTGLGSGSITQDIGFVYGEFRAGPVVLEGIGSFGGSDRESSRIDPLGTAAALRTASDGHDAAISVGVRIPFEADSLALTPYLRVTSERMSQGGFDEGTSSGAALSAARDVSRGTRSTAGLVAGSRDRLPTVAALTWQVDLGVGRDSAALATPAFDATLAGVGTVIGTPDVGRTFGFARMGGTARITSWMYGMLGVSAETRSGKSEDLGANLGVRATF